MTKVSRVPRLVRMEICLYNLSGPADSSYHVPRSRQFSSSVVGFSSFDYSGNQSIVTGNLTSLEAETIAAGTRRGCSAFLGAEALGCRSNRVWIASVSKFLEEGRGHKIACRQVQAPIRRIREVLWGLGRSLRSAPAATQIANLPMK